MRSMLLFIIIIVSGCGEYAKQNPPAPEVIRVPVRTYVEIPADLTARCAWTKSAPPSQALLVASVRKRCLLKYEAQLQAIEAINGTEVDP